MDCPPDWAIAWSVHQNSHVDFSGNVQGFGNHHLVNFHTFWHLFLFLQLRSRLLETISWELSLLAASRVSLVVLATENSCTITPLSDISFLLWWSCRSSHLLEVSWTAWTLGPRSWGCSLRCGTSFPACAAMGGWHLKQETEFCLLIHYIYGKMTLTHF